MAYSKAPLFDPISYQQSFWSKALAHPARITILDHLLQHGITPFYILAKKIPLARSTVSQHLRFLRQSGLIESFDKYPHTYYQLNHKACKDLARRLEALNHSFSGDNTQDPTINAMQG
ncbi:MAG: helix-turn-helix transcriptional regulator [Saprospiraceae bacterium]|nr:helix-turn-helix transcriptional regulator [Candidatus Opimibacter iunctus]